MQRYFKSFKDTGKQTLFVVCYHHAADQNGRPWQLRCHSCRVRESAELLENSSLRTPQSHFSPRLRKSVAQTHYHMDRDMEGSFPMQGCIDVFLYIMLPWNVCNNSYYKFLKDPFMGMTWFPL